MPHPLDTFFSPGSIALIGASRDLEKIPGRLLSMLRKNEFPGKIYPINPNYGDIDGLKCYPAIADVASDFVYARLQKGNDEIDTCYPPKQLDAWAKRFQLWAEGGEPDDLPRVDDTKIKKMPRDVFAYVIHEGKIRAPSGAMELIARVS